MTAGPIATETPTAGLGWRAALYRSPVYDFWLGRKPPSTVRALQSTEHIDAGAAWHADGLFPVPASPSTTARDDFRWLADPAIRPRDATAALIGWLDQHRQWSHPAWRADILAERHVRWLHAFDRLSVHLTTEQRQSWALALARESKHLARAPTVGFVPWRVLRVRQARLFDALALTAASSLAEIRLREFGAEVDSQISGDGGHIERNPARALAVLAMLVDSRDALKVFHIAPPQALSDAIDRMVPFIKGLRHGDGGFALMNGATAATTDMIDPLIAATGSKGRAMSGAPHVGFHRLRAGQTTVILDCGNTAPTDTPFRGAGAFEMSVGKTRLLGNCGARLIDDPHGAAWTQALTRTAAHSTVVVNDADMGDVRSATVSRREHEGARLIEATHDGYTDAYGIGVRRIVYLNAGGTDLRGEDIMTGGRAAPMSIRFHLYPDVRALMVEGGGEVILKPAKGRGWRFQSRHPVMLEDSVNFFDGRQHRAKQIVVLGNHEPATTTIKWRISMEG